jgi:hypothetical protein
MEEVRLNIRQGQDVKGLVKPFEPYFIGQVGEPFKVLK